MVSKEDAGVALITLRSFEQISSRKRKVNRADAKCAEDLNTGGDGGCEGVSATRPPSSAVRSVSPFHRPCIYNYLPT